MPKLRVLISTSTAYPPSTQCVVNGPPARVRTEHFEGEISVFIKGFESDGDEGDEGEAFFSSRPELTYALVVRGRYLDNVGGDDLVFGNVFERPIRDSLPWGTAIATRFMHFVDPTLELDVYADKPWALSPVLATMNRLSLTKEEAPTAMGIFRAVEEDALHILDRPETSISDRRKCFGTAENRERITFDSSLQTGMEFGSGLLDLATLSVTLPNSFPLSVSLLSYWDGQPVIYVCRRRSENPVTPEGMYWSVAFEIVDEEAIAALEKRGKSVLALQVKEPVDQAAEAPKPLASEAIPPNVKAETGPGPADRGNAADDSLSDDID
ncbi:hypothetical protein CcaverHIS002_0406990 [Cutaneotrichosporon cavernicola]|uniref:Domain of unknown function at the cortex 1 domain-containing protein n=1 Tax=Cutaneotrichosporon cavernicola TaxID=279322 RepID=A0AA48L4L7_9TREE|nr:uncharacterized protein CcaverHIS019_0407010 [Cutaneotrichosporon cavernicola]BEI84095.1 hypothetical protein CcaverHIS002_0406990 [Cutaneotrichosporon cavernicola]BEI91881.1 hypothetical protein CcaverHIS019_0407010 [Cutaneotrichosporon cavernicola]BEI99653.1 hypothetical protein CcaverHIS631_0406960 [Cutaneotrichosporon cavernicola]BEJ07427.1 hypothetical protein CcaverHIS641_0406960 [Cutaneotrichosporon cavernicola]